MPTLLKQLLPHPWRRFFPPQAACALVEHRFLFFPEPELVATPATVGLDYEEVGFSAADGIELHGWYVPGELHRPLVLFCHGNAGNIADRLRMLAFLRGLGLGIFIFDYRGYGRSSGKATEEGTYNDARGALSWLESRGHAARELIYLGRSLGAAVALQMAIERPPSGLVLECPFTSIADMARLHHPVLARLLGWLVEARYDNLAKIGRLRTPLLLGHGTADAVVPPEMGRRLFELAPEPKRFLFIEGGDHSDAYVLGNEDYRRTWLEFSALPASGRVLDTTEVTAAAPGTTAMEAPL